MINAVMFYAPKFLALGGVRPGLTLRPEGHSRG